MSVKSEYLEKMNDKHWLLMKEEIGATPKSLAEDAKKLVEWMQKQPHLPDVTDEVWLSHFLSRCKNSIERTKERLEAYFTMRATMPSVYSDRDPNSDGIKQAMDSLAFFFLPKLTEDGSRVVVMRVFNPSAYLQLDGDDVLKAAYMSADLASLLSEERNTIVVYDLDGFTAAHVSRSMSYMKKFVTAGTKGLPIRYKNLYILHLPSYAESFVNIAKSFAKKEIADRVQVLRNGASDLSQLISKDILPTEYGGNTRTLREFKDEWYETMKEHAQWFKEQDSVKADLQKIPPTSNYYIGCTLEGSFRKISID